VDYHDLMGARLEKLAAALNAQGAATRVYVDTGAILERSHAQQAGLGFIGKNTLLIHPQRGSYLFLGVILCTLAADQYDDPHPETACGACTRCLVACPTQAFPRPYVLDARRCISYLTIEYKGSIPLELRPQMGNWIYGCDVCQAVCPYVRRFTRPTPEAAFYPASLETAAPPLAELLRWQAADFKTQFQQSPILRIGYERFMRNGCVAAGNSRTPDLIPLLEKIARQSAALPLAAEHAAWGLAQLRAL
jgi:epoxyqueuosine reductase